MAQFNLNEYATVADRLAQLKIEYPDYRILTEDVTTLQDRAVLTWRVKATLFLNKEDQLLGLPKATGHAFEIDGQGMANKTSALENAESSAIGRCLMIAGWSMSKKNLASREEMEKVSAGVTPSAPPLDYLKVAEDLAWKKDLDGLITLYNKMMASKAPEHLIEKVKQIGNETRGSLNSAK